MKIVFDSSTLYNHWFLEGPEVELLLSYARETGARIVIPEVVIRETVKNYRDKTKATIHGIKDNQRGLRNLRLGKMQLTNAEIQNSLEIMDPGDPLDRIAENYEISLRGALRGMDAIIPTHDGVPQERILNRSLKRRKPFKSTGEGYQDALIWEAVISQIDAQGSIVFICSNTKDFSRDLREHAEELHDDLKANLIEAGVEETTVRLISSVGIFNETYSRPALAEREVLREAKEAVERLSPVWMESGWETTQEEIRALLDEGTESLLQQDSQLSMMERPEIVYIERPYDYRLQDVSVLDEGRLYVHLSVKAEFNIEGFILKSDYHLLNDPSSFSIWTEDWNEHYMFVSTAVKATFGLSLILNQKTEEVEQIEAEFAEFYGWCRHCGEPIVSDAAETCTGCHRSLF